MCFTDRSMAVPWALQCLPLWPTSTWRKWTGSDLHFAISGRDCIHICWGQRGTETLWIFIKTHTKHKKKSRKSRKMDCNVWRMLSYSWSFWEVPKGFLQAHIPGYFKLMNTLRQHLVHPKDWIPKHVKSNLVYVVRCSEEYRDLHWGN